MFTAVHMHSGNSDENMEIWCRDVVVHLIPRCRCTFGAGVLLHIWYRYVVAHLVYRDIVAFLVPTISEANPVLHNYVSCIACLSAKLEY